MQKQGLFQLVTPYQPAGDQPVAIAQLSDGLKNNLRRQTLLGVTGSGKTFTMANVIAQRQQPTLVIAHNKTLAAQLAQEFAEFFPHNAVHYFVSYYDYYQPEAYLPHSDTYIEKDAQINAEIDRLRHASTQSLLTRRDVIIVASVSCIYGLGSPEEYAKEHLMLAVGDRVERNELLRRLVGIFFERTNADLEPGKFRALGNRVEVMPIQEKVIYEVSIDHAHIRPGESEAGGGGSVVSEIRVIDAVSLAITATPSQLMLFPAKHFLTEKEQQIRAIAQIRAELEARLEELLAAGKLLEADRLKRRTNYDLAMMEEIGYCSGIENYSRHLSGKHAGEAPETLLAYFPHHEDGSPDFLTFIDESHVTLPQLRAMQAGDAARKKMLVEYGFRLPSALDNRPLRWEEFDERVGQLIYVSATPSVFERETSEQIVEQVIRPTGLIDPEMLLRPVRAENQTEAVIASPPRRTKQSPTGQGIATVASLPRNDYPYPGQIKDFIEEAKAAIKKDERVMATTLTKKMAEDLSVYLKEQGVRAEYLHSDIKTIDRIKILTSFRKGEFECLVGVNLLREGLDLPEVALIGIFDADREGFLRSETSLIQIIGRAARNVNGRVLLYADKLTDSLRRAMEETERRRTIQLAYNEAHGITPQTILKKIHDITESMESEHDKAVKTSLAADAQIFGHSAFDIRRLLKLKTKQMKQTVRDWDFETAALLRDEIRALEGQLGK
jgi:excinuclease ABC subunit B